MTNWEYVKDFYKEHFGIDGWIVELYANLDMLQLCASGASNETIISVCDIELDDLVEILMNTFQFPGWNIDLPINPYKLYLDVGQDYIQFSKELRVSNVFELKAIDEVFELCRTMSEIEERITDEWI